MTVEYELEYVAEYLCGRLIGDSKEQVKRLHNVVNAIEGDVCFISNNKYKDSISESNGTVIIVDEYSSDIEYRNKIVVQDVYVAYAMLSKLFVDELDITSISSGLRTCIDKSVYIGEGTYIGPQCTMEKGVYVGTDSYIGACTYIGRNSCIGNNVTIYPNVTIYNGIKIGNNSIIHSGSVIGSDGFGFANQNGNWIKIYQLGSVQIGNNVEIQANTTIDRGAIGDTIIMDGVKIDNQVQIAHNVKIGKNTAIAGCTAIAGSTTIGDNCMIGGCVCISGHLNICNNVTITGMCGVDKSIMKSGVYSSGFPAMERREWWKFLSKLIILAKKDTRKRCEK